LRGRVNRTACPGCRAGCFASPQSVPPLRDLRQDRGAATNTRTKPAPLLASCHSPPSGRPGRSATACHYLLTATAHCGPKHHCPPTIAGKHGKHDKRPGIPSTPVCCQQPHWPALQQHALNYSAARAGLVAAEWASQGARRNRPLATSDAHVVYSQ
jgi:hypothetical protein